MLKNVRIDESRLPILNNSFHNNPIEERKVESTYKKSNIVEVREPIVRDSVR